MIVLLFLLVLASLAHSACVYGQSHWALNSTVWPTPSLTLCSVNWRDLMAVECVKMARPLNAPWILVFHQYATAQLNLATLTPLDWINYSITLAPLNQTLLSLGDSLERGCANISLWWQQEQVMLYNALSLLRLFNGGTLGPGPCNPMPMQSTNPYYSHVSPDLILIPFQGGDGNMTVISYSLLYDEYRVRAFIVTFAAIALCIITVQTCVICLYANKKRKFFIARTGQEEPSAPLPVERGHAQADHNGAYDIL